MKTKKETQSQFIGQFLWTLLSVANTILSNNGNHQLTQGIPQKREMSEEISW